MATHSEHNIQNEIRLFCGQQDIPCFRCNVGKIRLPSGGYFDTGLPPGFSDLIILYNRTIYFCECKTATGRQREDQIRFQKYIESHGYIYFIARSIDDVKKILNL